MKKLQKGFTLIELLVVIAIIGILASIVLASLSTATQKGNDAKVEGQLASIRDAAQIYYASNGVYGNNGSTGVNCIVSSAGGCTGTTMWTDSASGMGNLMTYSSYPSGTTLDAGSINSAYSVAASLSGGKAWCVDSSGVSRGTTAAGVAYSGVSGSSGTAHPTAGQTTCN